MDTDLLDFSLADSPADNGELYGEWSALSRPVTVAASSSGTVTATSQPSAVIDSVESTTASLLSQPVYPPQSAILAFKAETHTLTGKPDSHALAGKPDPPPAPHGSPATPSPHYKSPVSANDGIPAAKPRPDVPQKTSTVPAIPPRKPRNPAANPAVPARPETSLSKTNQPQPPLPRITPVSRKSAHDSFSNRTYEVSALENPKRCTVEGNGYTPPPVPVPRNIATGNSEPSQVPASTSAPAAASNSPAPCDTLSSGEQVSNLSDLWVCFAYTKVIGKFIVWVLYIDG